jgi:biofilm PGA synthesis N-glycosyltransferase PgaC
MKIGPFNESFGLELKNVSLILYIFYGILIITSFRLGTWIILALIYNLKEKSKNIDSFPLISLIVPAFNEEKTIRKSIQSLLKLDYPNYEIIMVDDGSTDKTLDEVKQFETSKLKIIKQKNQGKANALNSGIKTSKGQIVVTVDADTTLNNDSLKKIATRFAKDQKIGAVAGNVKVIPKKGLFNVIQGTEYIIGINLIRKAQSILGCVMIVPGPIAALKRDALEKAGYFSDDTFAEDFDITMNILKQGYRVEYEDEAISYTDAPKNIEDLMKQRRRWYRGLLQVLDKHRNLYYNVKHGFFGTFGVPNMWFDALSPILNLTLILFALLSALFGSATISILGLVTIFLIQLIIGIFAVALDPQPKLRDFLAIPIQIFYNVFLDGIKLMSFTEETINVFMKWEKPER